jgi:hypothetical protein
VDEAKARELLKPWVQNERSHLHQQDDLYANNPEDAIVEWISTFDAEHDPPEWADSTYVDGRFSADQLEAIAWWMRNKRRA